jgi:hypothetical protein
LRLKCWGRSSLIICCRAVKAVWDMFSNDSPPTTGGGRTIPYIYKACCLTFVPLGDMESENKALNAIYKTTKGERERDTLGGGGEMVVV